MAELYYTDGNITIDDKSTKEHIFISFDSKSDFIDFYSDFGIEKLRSYSIKKNGSEELTGGFGEAISGIVIKYLGGTKLNVRIDVVQLSEKQILKDTVNALATTAMQTANEWTAGTTYKTGDVITYNYSLYRVIQGHTSQSDWTPDIVPALFVRVYKGEVPSSGDAISEWVQPTGAHDAYQANDVVTHSGVTWRSTVDNNVWEPGVYGWDEVTQDA